MSIIEFQVSASKFLAAQRTALRSLPLCPPRPIAAGPGEIVIDQIEFGNNALRHNVLADFPILYKSRTSTAPGIDVEGFQTQIAQDVTIHVTTLNDILSRPNQPPAFTLTLQGTLVFDLDFYALDLDCYLRTEFKRLEPGPLPSVPPAWSVNLAQVLEAVQKALRSLIPTRTVPASLSKLTELWANFINAGVSVDGALQRIAFRAQIGGDHDGVVTRWRAFLRGNVSDRLVGADWALFIDSGLLTEMVKAQINRGLADVDVDDLQLFVGCAYSNGGGKAVFTADVHAVYGLPFNVGTIGRDPRIPMEISVSAPNTLKLRADYSEVIAVIHSFGIVELILPSLSTGVERILQEMVASGLADLNEGDDAPYCKKLSDTIIECTKIVQMPQISSGIGAIMTKLLALDDGIAFAGTISSRSLTPSVLNTSFGKFAWTPPRVSCGQSSSTTVEDFRQNAAARSRLRAEVRMDHTGTTPVFICGAPRVLNDPLGAFPPTAIQLNRDLLPATFVITIPGLNPPPYQLDLLVSTTAGMRLVRVPPPPPLTPEIINFLADSVAVQLLVCDMVVGPWFDGVGTFDVAWIAVPLLDPPKETTFDHLWNVEITGLRDGQSISLANAANEEIVRAVASAGATTRLAALVPPAAQRELRVALDPGRERPAVGGDIVASTLDSRDAGRAGPQALTPLRGGHGQNRRGIEIRQQYWLHTRSIQLESPCSRLLPSPLRDHPGIVAVLRDQVVVFDLTNPHLPARTRSWRIGGVRGACGWQNRVLAFGAEGLTAIASENGPAPVGTDCELDDIVDVTIGRGVVYVLRAKTLEVRSLRLCARSTLPLRGGRAVSHTGGRLIVGGRSGLATYATSDKGRLSLTASRDDLHVTSLVVPPDLHARSVVAILKDGSARMFHVRSGQLDEIAVYARPPWFAESVRLGNLLIRLGSDRRHVTVGVLGESRLVVPVTDRLGTVRD